jgi:hypothetical protein
MADPQIRLKVFLQSHGIEPTTKQLKSMHAALSQVETKAGQTTKRYGEMYRNMRGTSQETGRAGKDFSRMSQGLGGLVAAYATVAANVFALSSAFLVLRRSADLSSMIKSAEDFSNRFGVSVTRITKQMQEASGGALSFADALPIINKAISAGIGTEQLEELTKAATKASQTFGGTANEALNRFISASQRGRVEIIQTLGIVIKTEKAYRDYAATIGKTAQELSAYDRQQAILNATIEESQNVFDQVNIDPNPFQQLLTTLIDTKNVISTFVTDAATPFLNSFNESRAAALALIAVLGKTVLGRIIPELGEKAQIAAKASLEAIRKAQILSIKAEKRHTKQLLEGRVDLNRRTKKQLKSTVLLFEEHYAETLKENKSFHAKLLNQDGTFNNAAFNAQRAALGRALALRKKGTILKGTEGIPTIALENQINRMTLLGKSIDGVGASMKRMGQATAFTEGAVTHFISSSRNQITTLNVAMAKLRSGIKIGFAESLQAAQFSFGTALTKMQARWGLFLKSIKTGGKSIEIVFNRLGGAIGASAGIVSAAFSKLLSSVLSISLAVSIGALIWEKYGDAIRGISPEMRAIITAGDEFQDSLQEVNERTAEGIVLLGKEFPESLKKVQDTLKFIAGTFASITTSIINFQKEIVNNLDNLTPDEALLRLQTIESTLDRLDKQRKFVVSGDELVELTDGSIVKAMQRLTDESEKLSGILQSIADTGAEKFGQSLKSAIDLAVKGGLVNIGQLLDQEFKKARSEGLGDVFPSAWSLEALKTAIANADIDTIVTEVDRLRNSLGDDKAFGVFLVNLLNFIKNFTGETANLNREVDQAIGRLREIDTNITTFLGGLDKARAASGKDKAVTGFVLDVNRELDILAKRTEGAGKNTLIEDVFGNEEQLATIKAFFGFTKNELVTVDALQARAVGRQKKILEATKARLVGAQQLKIEAIKLRSINEREVRTDGQRLKQIKDRLEQEKEITKQRLDTKLAEFTSAEATLNGLKQEGLDTSELELATRQAELNTLDEEITALKQRLGIQETNLDYEREVLNIQSKKIQSLKRVNKATIDTAKINQRISLGFAEDLKFRQEILKEQKRSLLLEQQNVRVKMDQAILENEAGAARERALAPLQAQLTLLEAQTRELERQDLIQQARVLESEGRDIFTSEGMEVLGQIFTRTLRDGVRNMKPTLETLARGFADTLNGTIDAAVDKLFEGRGFSGFADAVVEALKAGLRETFSSAIKDQIKGLFSDLFPETIEQKQIEASIANTKAVEANTQTRLAMSPGSTGRISTEGVAVGPEGLMKQIVTGVGDLNTTTETAKEEAKTNAFSIIQVLTTALSALGSLGGGVTSGIGGIFKTIFAAQGGVMQGLQVPKLAEGAITTRPQLAMIGEGNNREAVVPLPNNREIPVQLQGGQGDTINIENHYDFRNANADTVSQLRSEAALIEERTFRKVFSEMNKGGRYAKMSGRR